MDTGFEVMTDCFAYDKNRRECKALNELYCEKEGQCNFYKTPIQKKIRIQPKHSQPIDDTRTSLSGLRFH